MRSLVGAPAPRRTSVVTQWRTGRCEQARLRRRAIRSVGAAPLTKSRVTDDSVVARGRVPTPAPGRVAVHPTGRKRPASSLGNGAEGGHGLSRDVGCVLPVDVAGRWRSMGVEDLVDTLVGTPWVSTTLVAACGDPTGQRLLGRLADRARPHEATRCPWSPRSARTSDVGPAHSRSPRARRRCASWARSTAVEAA
jgi:hypothetical protein